jgi:hypothetical protein
VSPELPLTEKIARVTQALDTAAIPHAVGGAIALGYHAEPRGTLDIDVDVFLPESGAGRVFGCLEPLGVVFDRATALETVDRTTPGPPGFASSTKRRAGSPVARTAARTRRAGAAPSPR